MTRVDQPGVKTASGEIAAVLPRRKTTLAQQQRRWGWIFLSPWIFGFVVFTAAPIVASLIFTFTDFNLSSTEINFIGYKNWQRL